MPRLNPPDLHHFNAAEGWLELGSPSDALVELDRISTTAKECFEALTLRWSIMAAFKSWDDCVRIAEKIVEVAPKNSFGWIHRSFALHELKRTQEARALLLPAAHRFPKQDIICYNLACYECQLGNTEAAREWLKKSMQLKKPGIIKARALSDEDLKPMWAEIERMQIPVKQRGTDTPPGVE